MVDILAQWLGVIGLDGPLPATFSELIPYLLYVFVGIGLMVAILRMFRAVVMALVTRNPRL